MEAKDLKWAFSRLLNKCGKILGRVERLRKVARAAEKQSEWYWGDTCAGPGDILNADVRDSIEALKKGDI